MTATRLSGFLSQAFVDNARTGEYIDGCGLRLIVTDHGRRYEMRDVDGREHVGDADTMTLEQARRKALEMREERELGNARLAFSKPLRPADLHRFVNEWTRLSISAAAQ